MDTTLIYMQKETIERYNMTEQTNNKTEERKNRFSGESYMLTKEEADRHDCIFLAESMAEFHADPDTKDKHYKIMRKHLDWFRQHNAEAYMVLLD